jgi:hypothetical protein
MMKTTPTPVDLDDDEEHYPAPCRLAAKDEITT